MHAKGWIDTHAHVFLCSLPAVRHPRYFPDYDATPDRYLALLDEHGIATAFLIQPSFLGSRNEFLLDCLTSRTDRFHGVVVLDHPGDIGSLDRVGVIGARINAIGGEVPDLTGRAWRQLGRELARRGQHLEVQASTIQWLELVPALADWPSAVVIDHLGLPGTPADELILRLSRRQHVWVKVSAPYRSLTGAAEAMLKRLLDECGPQRLLWGSDWPWTQHESGRTYADCVQWLSRLVESPVLHDIMATNPARLIGDRTDGRL
ncbi:amidohydrolase family protein [Nocardia sp. NPDC052278]|uniref:amidohydrolase family protein n=1 Tax=unclassified Nocardia TaxID=2637762 RepID=UPI0036829850